MASLHGDLSPKLFRVGIYGSEVSFGDFSYEFLLGEFRVGTYEWDLSVESFRICVVASVLPLGIFR